MTTETTTRVELDLAALEVAARGPSYFVGRDELTELLRRARQLEKVEAFLRGHGGECWCILSLQEGAEQSAAFEALEKLLEAFGLDSTGAPC